MNLSGEELTLTRAGHRIFCRRWLCRKPADARANLLIAHGMGEHSERYGELAHALTKAQFNVYAPDLRGHGKSLPSLIAPGDMGHNGWQETLEDLAFLEHWMTEEYDRPAILCGHSMGAMLAQEYIYTLGQRLQALVLSGSTGVFPRLPALLLSNLARFDSWRLSPATPSPLLSRRVLSMNNRNFERQGDGDEGLAWLSRDKERVAAYHADPLCGAGLTAGGLAEMFASQARSTQDSNIQRIGKHVPIYLFAGREDPLNNQGKRLMALQKRYQAAGLRADLKLYPQGRHEMLNELNRAEVIDDLLHWLTKVTHD